VTADGSAIFCGEYLNMGDCRVGNDASELRLVIISEFLKGKGAIAAVLADEETMHALAHCGRQITCNSLSSRIEPGACHKNATTRRLRKKPFDELIHTIVKMGNAILPVSAHDPLDLFRDQTEI
jgi:hypothetical protein